MKEKYFQTIHWQAFEKRLSIASKFAICGGIMVRNGIRRLLAAGLMLFLCFGTVSCGDKNTDETKEPTKGAEKTAWQEGSVMRVGGTQVDYREAMLYLQSTKEEYETMYGNGIWQYTLASDGSTLGEWVKDQTLEQIIYMKIVCGQAETLGISLNEEDWANVNDQTVEYMGKFKDSDLALYGINEEIVRRIYADNALALKVYESVTLNVETDVSDEEARQRRLQSMTVRNYHEDGLGNHVSLTVLELIAALDKVNDLMKRAEETNDFYSLAFANTEDDTYLDIVVGKGELPEELEAEVLSMRTGELKRINTDENYYIFYCVSDYEEDATLAKKEELITKRQEEEFERLYGQWKAAAVVEINEEIWKAVGFDTGAQG